MADETSKPDDPHVHDEETGTKHGVPHGAAQEESKGVPDSGRQTSEAAPVHDEAETEQAKDI